MGNRRRWTGLDSSGSVFYRAKISSAAVKSDIAPELEIVDPGAEWREFLVSTPTIDLTDQKVIQLSQDLAPAESHLTLAVLRQIFNHVSGLDHLLINAELDASSTARLGIADARGKSRLFVALARLNDLPSRVVGGVVFSADDVTDHVWVEVNLENQWIPFDPANHLFAELPVGYVKLFNGDEKFIAGTAELKLGASLVSNIGSVSSAIYPELDNTLETWNFAALLDNLQIPRMMIGIFLLMPVTALVITFLRNVVGIKTFGIFLPMLIGAACATVGLWTGLIGFVAVVSVAFVTMVLLAPLRLLKIPRLAAVLSVVMLSSFLMLSVLNDQVGMTFGMLALFPLIIICFIADKLHDLAEEEEWWDLTLTALGTFVSAVLCYLIMTTVVLQSMFALYPELYLMVIAAQINLGHWTGVRLSELVRFRKLIGKADQLLGINSRNRDYVSLRNPKAALRMATDKLATKQRLHEYNVPAPETYLEVSHQQDIEETVKQMQDLGSFVVKPNRGSKGKGIAVISEGSASGFTTVSGKEVTTQEMRLLLSEIIQGQHSQSGEADVAFLERVVIQPECLDRIAPYGLADIRLIVVEGTLECAMLRLPTIGSGGKANLHQGAVAGAIDLDSGKIVSAARRGVVIEMHPDSGERICGYQIPHWPAIKAMAERCYEAINLGFMGVDISLDRTRGPLVLEVNGRPGLEIQNVMQRGLVAAGVPTDSHEIEWSSANV